jgi:hypothetical protein
MKRFLLCSCAFALLAGCSSADATYAVIDNRYPGFEDGGNAATSVAVYRGWWLVATFPTPVPGGAASESERVITGSDYAYFVLAPGWDPSSGEAPTRLVPSVTKDKVSVARGSTLQIEVDDMHVRGNCGAGQPLSQAEADFVTQSIFPGAFAGLVYDAATCTMHRASDGGLDAAVTDGSADVGHPPDEGGDAGAAD